MSVNEIGAAGHLITGYETRKTERNAVGGNFAKQAELVSGSSYSVYKTQVFDPENPVYKVKVWDKSGNVTEQMVDVSNVDPKNCSTVEMYAYTANLKESGKGSFEDTVLKAVVAKTVKDNESSSGAWSFSDKFDWAKVVNDLMQSSYRYGDLKGYMEWKKFLGFMKIAEEKAAQDETTDYAEKAFDMGGPNAPQDVKDAWMEAAKEVNANGLGIRSNGMMSHISQMMVQRLNKMLKGETENPDILGNTVQSAIRATEQALYDLDHPLASAYRSIEAEQGRIKEREFYIAFLEKLKKL